MQNLWPRRLLITGGVLICLASIALLTGWGDFVSAMDPENNHVAKVEADSSKSVNLSEDKTYIAYRLDSSTVNLTISEIQTNTEIERSSPGMLDGDRFGENSRIYISIGVYEPDADGAHLIQNLDQEDPVWLVDKEDLGEGSTILLILEIACFAGICGVCLMPLGGILWFTGRKKSYPTSLMMDASGGLQKPITGGDNAQHRIPTTDEVWASVHADVPLDLSVPSTHGENDVPPPFADRPDGQQSSVKIQSEIELDSIIADSELDEEIKEGPGNSSNRWKEWDEG